MTYSAYFVEMNGINYYAEYSISPFSRTVTAFIMTGDHDYKIRISPNHPEYAAALAAARGVPPEEFGYLQAAVAPASSSTPQETAPANDTNPASSTPLGTDLDDLDLLDDLDDLDNIKKLRCTIVCEDDIPDTPILGIGWRIEFNNLIRRTQIIFDKFPTAQARETVKAAGFYWSPNNRAWQRKLNRKSVAAAQDVAQQLGLIRVFA